MEVFFVLKEYASDYIGRSVGFVGMGVSNLPVIRLFASNGANCSVRDKNDLSQREFYQELVELGVTFICGDNYLDGIDESLLFLSPAVRPDLEGIVEAKKRGTAKVTAKNLYTGGKLVYTVKIVPDYDD